MWMFARATACPNFAIRWKIKILSSITRRFKRPKVSDSNWAIFFTDKRDSFRRYGKDYRFHSLGGESRILLSLFPAIILTARDERRIERRRVPFTRKMLRVCVYVSLAVFALAWGKNRARSRLPVDFLSKRLWITPLSAFLSFPRQTSGT